MRKKTALLVQVVGLHQKHVLQHIIDRTSLPENITEAKLNRNKNSDCRGGVQRTGLTGFVGDACVFLCAHTESQPARCGSDFV